MQVNKINLIEWAGVVCAMIASYLVAANAGMQGIGYIFYMLSCFFVGYVCWKIERRGLFLLQIYFTVINGIGIWTYLIRPLIDS